MLVLDLWQACSQSLKDELPSQQFNTWIRPLQALDVSAQPHVLTLKAPNRFISDWVKSKYLIRIEQLLNQLSEGEYQQIHFSSDAKPALTQAANKTPLLKPSEILSKTEYIEPVQSQVYISESLPEDSSTTYQHKSHIMPDYTFDTFIEGKSNQLARAAAMQVASNPGGSYNPLFLYGSVGLGKTHLMHAVGPELLKKNPKAKVLYIHSERFMADMVNAYRLKAIDDFRNYYHGLDALFVDDIQFFANKEGTQEQFFSAFNALTTNKQQIILTSDRFPKEIKGLDDRLKSRFSWGLTVAVEPPELETRAAILLKKAEQSNVHLPEDAAFFIAKRIRANVRDLEGALRNVMAMANFKGRAIDIDLVKESLKDLLSVQDRLISIENIQKTVAEYYKIKLADLSSESRRRSVTRPRQVAMAIAKELTNHSLPEIGDAFGGRDHTTVLHACRKVQELKESSQDICEDIKNLQRLLIS